MSTIQKTKTQSGCSPARGEEILRRGSLASIIYASSSLDARGSGFGEQKKGGSGESFFKTVGLSGAGQNKGESKTGAVRAMKKLGTLIADSFKKRHLRGKKIRRVYQTLIPIQPRNLYMLSEKN